MSAVFRAGLNSPEHDVARKPVPIFLHQALGRCAMICCALLLALAWAPAVRAESPAPVLSTKEAPAATSDKLRQLLDLIDDPEVRALLDKRKATPVDAAPVPHGPDTMAGSLGDGLQGLRDHLRALAAAAPQLPRELGTARSMLFEAVGQREAFRLWFFLAVFVALGFGAERLFHAVMTRWRKWLLGLELNTRAERLWAVFARLAYGLGLVASFALGSVGAFLLFDWTILLKQILLGYLLAMLLARLCFVFGRFFLAPGAARFRVAPLDTPAATFLFYRIGILAVLAAFGTQTITLLGSFGFSPVSRELSSYVLGLVVLAIGIEMIWRYPHAPPPQAAAELEEQDGTERRMRRRFSAKLVLTAFLPVLGGLWVVQAYSAFWLAVFAIGLPAIVVITQRSIRHILRPTEAMAQSEPDAHRLELIFVERGIRSLLIIAGALLLANSSVSTSYR